MPNYVDRMYRPPTSQGRPVVRQGRGGAQGIVGRGGNFQPLGAAALRKLPGGGAAGAGGVLQRPVALKPPPGTQVDPGMPFAKPLPTGRPGVETQAPTAEGPGIEEAIKGLKGQLGMPLTDVMPDAKPLPWQLGGGPGPYGPIDPSVSDTPTRPFEPGTVNSLNMLKPRFNPTGTGAVNETPGFVPGPNIGAGGSGNPYAQLLRQRLPGLSGTAY